jgi:Fur family ferric uptake transcriptional regulator
MQTIHDREKRQFKKLFKDEKIDRFEDRYAVLDVFLQTEQHVTVSELAKRIQTKGLSLSAAFLEETLQLMCQFGFAHANRFDNGEIRYEHLHLGQHHDHMVCTKCNQIIEFNDPGLESLQMRIAASHGFHLLQHKMELYGICSKCLESRVPLMPLARAKPGENVIIRDFTGGRGSRMRLVTMGLRVGDKIQIINNLSQGQLAVAMEFNRLIIGSGMAQKILVEPVNR